MDRHDWTWMDYVTLIKVCSQRYNPQIEGELIVDYTSHAVADVIRVTCASVASH